jgi:hypothetical protein
MGVMQKAVEERGHSGGVTEELAPIIHGSIRREQRGGPFVPAHDQFKQILRSGVRQLPHAQVVDDQQRHDGEIS